MFISLFYGRIQIIFCLNQGIYPIYGRMRTVFCCCLNQGLYPIYGKVQTIIRLVQGLLYTWFIRNETTMSPTQIVSDLTIYVCNLL